MTKRILVPIGCRSDEGLSAPVIKRLREHFEVETPQLSPQDFGASYQLMDLWLHGRASDCSLVLITGDRVEMCAAAAAAFHNKVPIAHFYAGVVNSPITTFDDIDRHCITLWSDICFCEDIFASYKAAELNGIYIPSMPFHPETCLESSGIFVVGISHLDDLEIDTSKVPMSCHNGYDPIDYDLVLINNEPLGKTPSITRERYTIQIGGNPDGTFPIIGDERHGNLPRPQFLGLLKNCKRFITNSSAAIYEAPYFLEPHQIILIGERNRNRRKVECKPGGSEKIVTILTKLFAEGKIKTHKS